MNERMRFVQCFEDNAGSIVLYASQGHDYGANRVAYAMDAVIDDGCGLTDMIALAVGDVGDWTVERVALGAVGTREAVPKGEVVAELEPNAGRPVIRLHIGYMGAAARTYFGIRR